MAYAGEKDPQKRADIVDYLNSLSDSPKPLPQPTAAAAPAAGQTQGGGQQPSQPRRKASNPHRQTCRPPKPKRRNSLGIPTSREVDRSSLRLR